MAKLGRLHCLCVLFSTSLLLATVSGELALLTPRLPLQGIRWPPGSPWPMPRHWEGSRVQLTMQPDDFSLEAEPLGCDILDLAFLRYRRVMFIGTEGRAHEHLARARKLKVTVRPGGCEMFPSMESDEYYHLNVSDVSVLEAKSVWGALRGLETFSQLVYLDDAKKYRINVTEIEDWPRFKYRGLMVDTARHFIPVKLLKMNLDAMAYNKYNVLHWHLIDDQAFTYQSVTFPELTRKGAYTSHHIYSQADIQEIVNYSRLRGIRVIPEFDTPGHTYSWRNAYPELLTPCWAGGEPGQANYTHHAAYQNLDPTRETTYTFVKKLFEEVSRVFPDQFIHLGMDEAHPQCWHSSPLIREFLEDRGFNGDELFNLEQLYIDRVMSFVTAMGKDIIIWQDPVEHGARPPKDVLVHIWKDDELSKGFEPWANYASTVVRAGYRIILSSCWYLNYISYGQDWRKYYECDPLQFPGSFDHLEKVVGGEVCLWGEYVDGTNFLQRLWPRASAVAERLWSPEEVNDTDNAFFRLDQHRCRMLRRGIPAQPIMNGYCGDYEYGMNDDDDGYILTATSGASKQALLTSLGVWLLSALIAVCVII